MEMMKQIAGVIAGLLFLVLVGAAVIEYFFDDNPTEGFTRQLLEQHGPVEIIQVFDRFEKITQVGRQREMEYSYRTFVVHQKDKKTQDLYKVEGQVRCYPGFRTWIPLDDEDPFDFCNVQELKRTLIEPAQNAVEDGNP